MTDMARGERIRDARQKTGLSQTAFAENAGVSKRAQIRYEQGEPPTADYLVELDKMNVDVSYVLTGRTIEQRMAELESRLDALKETTRIAGELTSDSSKRELIRDVLLGVRWSKVEIIEAAIERYMAVRSVQPTKAKKGTK